MADDPNQPHELDDAEEAKLVAEADEGEKALPEFADARDAGATDALADAGEGAHIDGIVRAGLTMVPEVTVDFEAADERNTLDRDLPADPDVDDDLRVEAADRAADRAASTELDDRPPA